MGAKGEKSHDVASGVAKRSLVRLLIPFSFAAHFEAWREMDEARRDKPRRQALAERLTHGLVGSKRRAQKLCDERHFPLYHALTERFLDADRERPIWRPIATSELDNASGALLPQLVDNLLRDRSRGEAEVTIFELSADARADILGERLFMTRANTYDKARKAAGRSGRRSQRQRAPRVEEDCGPRPERRLLLHAVRCPVDPLLRRRRGAPGGSAPRGARRRRDGHGGH